LKHVGLAADLAVFDVTLAASGGFVHCGDIPFTAARALKTRFHYELPFGNFPIIATLSLSTWENS
jgi:hypothetical protein